MERKVVSHKNEEVFNLMSIEDIKTLELLKKFIKNNMYDGENIFTVRFCLDKSDNKELEIYNRLKRFVENN